MEQKSDRTSAPTGAEPELRARIPADGQPPLALVLGATGYLGGRLVARLLNGGYRVRVLARRPERLDAFSWAGRVDVIVGDAADEPVMRAATEGVQVLYYLIHSMISGSRFEHTDRQLALTTARTAAASGVGRIVYLGGLHPGGDLSRHLRSRVEVGHILLGSGVPTLALQAGVVIGSGSASFEMVRHLTEVLPYMPAPRWVRNHIQPIAVRDVLHYLLGAALVPPEVNAAIDIGGPDVLRYDQMMNGYAAEAGLHKRHIVALPVLTPWLASHWVNLVTPIPRSIARPLVESLQHDCVVRDRSVDALIPSPAGGLTPYRRAVQLALGRIDADSIETSWQDQAVLGAPSDPLPSDPDWAGRTVYTDVRTARTRAPAEQLWAVIAGIGGNNGWYSTPLLWSLRGWADKLAGGVGLARGRRSRSEVAVGDAIDFWRVEALDPGRMLRLRAEMRAPGLAWLELRASPESTGSRFDQRAVFFPRGLAGRLYWLAVLPFHGLIFRGMAHRITAAAEAAERNRGHHRER